MEMYLYMYYQNAYTHLFCEKANTKDHRRQN